MARTITHRPVRVLQTQNDLVCDQHRSRDPDVAQSARRHNRRDRHTARAHISKGQYDDPAQHVTGRHTGAWAAS